MATYTFTLRSGGGTLVDAGVSYGGGTYDIDAALAAGSGTITTTDGALAETLRQVIRSDGLTLLLEGGVGAGGAALDRRGSVPLFVQGDQPITRPYLWEKTSAGVPTGVREYHDGTSPQLVASSSVLPDRGARPLSSPAKAIHRFASGHGWTQSGATGFVDDTSVQLFGRSLKGTTNGAAGSCYFTSPVFAAVDLTNYVPRVIFRVDDPSKVASVQLYATTTAGNQYVAGVPGNFLTADWNVITFPKAVFTVAAGAPSWSSITKFDIRSVDKGGAAPFTINLQAVEWVPDKAAVYPSGAIVVEFDDGFPGQYTNGLPVCDLLGVPVTHNIITERFLSGGASGKVAADLQGLQRQHGWAVSCHAYAQSFHDTASASAAACETDFRLQKQWLHDNGLHYGADDFAFNPGTGTNAVAEGAVMDVVRKYFRTAREFGGNGYQEHVDPGAPHRLRAIGYTGQTNSQLQQNIDNAASAGGVLFVTFHDVIAGSVNGTSNGLPAIAAANLNTILTYALSPSKGMVPRTRADIYDGR